MAIALCAAGGAVIVAVAIGWPRHGEPVRLETAPSTPAAAVAAPPRIAAESTPNASASNPPDVAPAVAAPARVVEGRVLAVVAEPDDGEAADLVARLQPLSGAQASLHVTSIASRGWRDSLTALKGAARVAVVRYDVLQAARADKARLPALEIVAPLVAEPIHFVVRADSPLKFIHEIEGRTLDVGGAGSSRALTATTAYRAMFGSAPRRPTQGALDLETALKSVGTDGRADAVVFVGTWPESLVGGDGAPASARWRELRLDPADARTARATRTFLSIPSRRAGGEGASANTLGVMSFLVTAASTGRDAEAHDETIAAVATALCTRPGTGAAERALIVQPLLRVDVGWPYSPAAENALARCSGAPLAAAAHSKTP